MYALNICIGVFTLLLLRSSEDFHHGDRKDGIDKYWGYGFLIIALVCEGRILKILLDVSALEDRFH